VAQRATDAADTKHAMMPSPVLDLAAAGRAQGFADDVVMDLEKGHRCVVTGR
jgi:hypothetical protein